MTEGRPLLAGPGLGFQTEMLQVVHVVFVQHRLVRVGHALVFVRLEESFVTLVKDVHLGKVQRRVELFVGFTILFSEEAVPRNTRKKFQ